MKNREWSYPMFVLYLLIYPVLFSFFGIIKGNFDLYYLVFLVISFTVVGSVLYYYFNERTFKKTTFEKIGLITVCTSFVVLVLFLIYIIVFLILNR